MRCFYTRLSRPARQLAQVLHCISIGLFTRIITSALSSCASSASGRSLAGPHSIARRCKYSCLPQARHITVWRLPSLLVDTYSCLQACTVFRRDQLDMQHSQYMLSYTFDGHNDGLQSNFGWAMKSMTAAACYCMICEEEEEVLGADGSLGLVSLTPCDGGAATHRRTMRLPLRSESRGRTLWT